jgi:hypothetical protein
MALDGEVGCLKPGERADNESGSSRCCDHTGIINHMPEQTGSVAVQDRETEAPSPRLHPEGPDTSPTLEIRPEQKCPYLAGRPPHGSYHLWPSGVNVCYARGANEKTYGHASKETQHSRCFSGVEGYESCGDFQGAQARGIALPIFEGTGPSAHRVGHETPNPGRRRERTKRRQRRSWVQKWVKSSAASTFVCACWILLALVAYWLVKRTM